MTTTANPNRVLWIDAAPRRPLCDVPWLGTSVVLSDGGVNFCCFSSAVVGNVNDKPFEQIWSGTAMQRIRRELTEQRLPHECQSTSCPIYRGDDLHYILGRMEGHNRFKVTGTHDPHLHVRQRLQGSELRVSSDHLQTREVIEVSVDLHCQGAPIVADLFVAIHPPDGVSRFFPNGEEYAVPCLADVKLCEDRTPLRLDALVPGDRLQITGNYQICAALFERGSNPNLLSNCYWSAVSTFTVN